MVGGGSGAGSLVEEVAARVRRFGPLGFDEVMDLALYDAQRGFYTVGGAAGRRADFLTSPEVGPLFGAVVSRAIDQTWRDMGEPDPFLVVEAGAGVGTLARTVLEAAPECSGALTYVLVEQSELLRSRQTDHLSISAPGLALPPVPDDETHPVPAGTGPRFVSLAALPRIGVTGVILANELLDNLPFRILERADDRWQEIRVGLDGDALPFVEMPVPIPSELAALAERLAPDAVTGSRIPIQSAATEWVRSALSVIERGRLIVIDYGSDTAAMAGRRWTDWIRTYRGHARGGAPLDQLGEQDITADVALDQLPGGRHRTERRQADFLRSVGIDELVEEGRRVWEERAAIGDLEALKGRSRVREVEALTDPDGLGAFWVIEWSVNEET